MVRPAGAGPRPGAAVHPSCLRRVVLVTATEESLRVAADTKPGAPDRLSVLNFRKCVSSLDDPSLNKIPRRRLNVRQADALSAKGCFRSDVPHTSRTGSGNVGCRV